MMKNIFVAMLLVLAMALPVFAQDNAEVSPGPDDYDLVGIMFETVTPTWPTAGLNSWVEGPSYPFQYSTIGYQFSIPSAFSIKKTVTLTLTRKVQYKDAAGVWKQGTSGGLPMKSTLTQEFTPSPHWIWYGWAFSYIPDQAGLHRVVFTAKKADGTVVWNNINMFWVGNE